MQPSRKDQLGYVLGIGHLTKTGLGQLAGDICEQTGRRESQVCEQVAAEVCRHLRSGGFACWISPLDLPAYTREMSRTPNFTDVITACHRWQETVGFSEVRYIELHACAEETRRGDAPPNAPANFSPAPCGHAEVRLNASPTPRALALAGAILAHSNASPAHPLALAPMGRNSRVGKALESQGVRTVMLELQLGRVGDVRAAAPEWAWWLAATLARA